ncbi:hypothetical protein L1887_03369 [Cichorium endivia]|nr:hypothetical protein L1887_03369 [Cichorium endivia]
MLIFLGPVSIARDYSWMGLETQDYLNDLICPAADLESFSVSSLRLCLVELCGIDCLYTAITRVHCIDRHLNLLKVNLHDNTKVSLVYANVSPDDILLKKLLDMLAATNPNLKVFYTLPQVKIPLYLCGPPGMMQHISSDKGKDRLQGEVMGILKELGYTEEMVYKF